MRVIKLRDFVFQNYYKWVEFQKIYSMNHQKKQYLKLFITKLTDKTSGFNDAKEHLN